VKLVKIKGIQSLEDFLNILFMSMGKYVAGAQGKQNDRQDLLGSYRLKGQLNG
jgi:hypothetical protein